MNQQRIKELWDKANSRYYQSESGQPLPQFIFAELIVQECADLFEVEWGDEKLTGNDAGYVLKKHFGVKE